MQELVRDISRFDATLFGIVDLNRAAYSKGATYIPAIIIVLLSAVLQYFVSKQLSPSAKDARGLKSILGDAKEGKKADQSDVSAAVNRNMLLLTPFIIAFVTLGIPAALALYLLTSSVVAYFQQRYILSKDEVELEAIADGEPVEAVVELPDKPKTKDKKKATSSKRKKRR
jgi:membrane protein insertase Oxa1/YidC/SpoIIIJ